MEVNLIPKELNIAGVSEEIQNNIQSDIQASIYNKDYHSLLMGKSIGISVSDNEELAELGYSVIHLKDLMLEIVRNLLINGATIVYGGNLSKEGYTYLFSDLAYQYRDKKESRKMLFQNYFAYPIYYLLTTEDKFHFKNYRTEIIKVQPPRERVLDNGKYFPANTIEAKLIWAQSLTEMRNTMITNTSARILVGGKMSSYLGKMPGLIEEAKITLEQKKPLYLIGALGGAANQVINALKGEGFSYINNEFHQSEEYKEFKSQFNNIETNSIDAEVDAAFFKEFGIEQLSQINGLTPEENKRLFISSNLPEILYYIFKGMNDTFSTL